MSANFPICLSGKPSPGGGIQIKEGAKRCLFRLFSPLERILRPFFTRSFATESLTGMPGVRGSLFEGSDLSLPRPSSLHCSCPPFPSTFISFSSSRMIILSLNAESLKLFQVDGPVDYQLSSSEGPGNFRQIKWLTLFPFLFHHLQQTGQRKPNRMRQHEKAVGPLAGRSLERCWSGSSNMTDLVASGSLVIVRWKEAGPTSFSSAIDPFFQSALDLLRPVDPITLTPL
jgi:hypothetical protein